MVWILKGLVLQIIRQTLPEWVSMITPQSHHSAANLLQNHCTKPTLSSLANCTLLFASTILAREANLFDKSKLSRDKTVATCLYLNESGPRLSDIH
eukprot:Gb_41403 [translate_table: standard]